ncbi:hypothetical protein AB0M19_23575, partial [Streptomyces sp. NPDC051920]
RPGGTPPASNTPATPDGHGRVAALALPSASHTRPPPQGTSTPPPRRHSTHPEHPSHPAGLGRAAVLAALRPPGLPSGDFEGPRGCGGPDGDGLSPDVGSSCHPVVPRPR